MRVRLVGGVVRFLLFIFRGLWLGWIGRDKVEG